MAEYIEKETMIEEMQRLIDNVSRNFPKATETELIILKGKYEAFMEYIKEQPTADVQPVKRGHWYDVGAEYIKEIGQFKIHAFCSECHRLNYYMDDYSQNMEAEFCQHCGADMRSPEPIKG